MGYTGFFEDLPFGGKACLQVKRFSAELGMQKDGFVAPFGCCFNDLLQQGAPDTLATPFRQYGHTPDLAVFQQSRCTEGCAIRRFGDPVLADRINAVPLQCLRNVLFEDKYSMAYLFQACFIF